MQDKVTQRNLALCIGQNDLNRHMGDWHVFLADRAIVDDKNAVFPLIKQLLVYVTFYSSSKKQVLTYSRGKNSGEIRLKNRSIGFGGHCEKIPDLSNTPPYIESRQKVISELLAAETMRELADEELPGFVTNRTEMFLAIKNQIDDWEIRKIDIRYKPVDLVHMGISVLIDVDKFPSLNLDALNGEENIVVDLRWETYDDLIYSMTGHEGWPAYEGWSLYVLQKFFGFEKDNKSLSDSFNQVNPNQLENKFE